MARTTRPQLERHCERANDSWGNTEENGFYIQHQASGWSLMRRVGPGASAFGECLTARELQQLLIGLERGADRK